MNSPVSPDPASVFTTGSSDTAMVDLVSAGRHVTTGEYLAGLMAAAQLDTVGTPRKLPADLFPDVDPVVVQEVWDRACAVMWRAAQFAGQPWLYRETLAVLQGRLEEAGHRVMAGMVGRSRELVVRSRVGDADAGSVPDVV